MKTEHRYIATMDFYLFENSDKKAIKKIKKLEKKLSKYLDKINGESRLKIRSLNSQEFGEFVNKEVEL